MPIIVGLGNIGEEYESTRHNIGFDIVDELAKTMSARFTSGSGPYLEAIGRFKGQKVVLIKPTTFMNRSGVAVRKALNKYNIDLTDCMICYDDLNLPLGTIRIREKGSTGGHNGIDNLIQELGTNKFPRLRFGIGSDFPKGRQVDFVLSPFDESEADMLNEAKEKAHEACISFLKVGITRTMNWFN